MVYAGAMHTLNPLCEVFLNIPIALLAEPCRLVEMSLGPNCRRDPIRCLSTNDSLFVVVGRLSVCSPPSCSISEGSQISHTNKIGSHWFGSLTPSVFV